jgi:hypothetical protein
MPVRQSLRNLQRRGAFIAAFTNEKLTMDDNQKKFTQQLAIFHLALSNPCTM